MSDLEQIKKEIEEADKIMLDENDLTLLQMQLLYEKDKMKVWDMIKDFYLLGFYYGYKQAKEENGSNETDTMK